LYPVRPLSDALELDTHSVELRDDAEYQIAGVLSFGRGLFARRVISGGQTKYTKLTRIRQGQLVVSRLKAFEGAIGIVPPELDGFFVSQEFPTLRTRPGIDSDFMRFLCRWPSFWESLRSASKGVGARRERVHVDQLLRIGIPLPPVDEQRRIGQFLDRVFERTELLIAHSRRADTLARSLRWAELRHEFGSMTKRLSQLPLAETAEINPEPVAPERQFAGSTFEYVDIGSVGKGSGVILSSKRIPAAEAPQRARRRIRAGDVLVSTVRPNLRGFATVPDRLDGQVCSTGFAVLRPRETMRSDFLCLQVLSDSIVSQLTEEATGGHYPAVTDRRLRQVRVVQPDLVSQRECVGRLGTRLARIDDLVASARKRPPLFASFALSVLNHALTNAM
jgi:type I restriction enzyme S subunit